MLWSAVYVEGQKVTLVQCTINEICPSTVEKKAYNLITVTATEVKTLCCMAIIACFSVANCHNFVHRSGLWGN